MRVFNFAAGPSTLPLPVLEEAKKDLLNYQDSGMSVMEMSHRSKPFMAINQEANALLRELMGIPDDYSVLFALKADRFGESLCIGSKACKAVHKARKSVWLEEYLLLTAVPFVAEHKGKGRVEKGGLPHSFTHRVRLEFYGVEYGIVGVKGDLGTRFALFRLAHHGKKSLFVKGSGGNSSAVLVHIDLTVTLYPYRHFG